MVVTGLFDYKCTLVSLTNEPVLLHQVCVTPSTIGGVEVIRQSKEDAVTSPSVEIVPSIPTIPFVINPTKFIFFLVKMDKDPVFVDISPYTI